MRPLSCKHAHIHKFRKSLNTCSSAQIGEHFWDQVLSQLLVFSSEVRRSASSFTTKETQVWLEFARRRVPTVSFSTWHKNVSACFVGSCFKWSIAAVLPKIYSYAAHYTDGCYVKQSWLFVLWVIKIISHGRT